VGDGTHKPPSSILASARRTLRSAGRAPRRVSATDWATSDHLQSFADNSTAVIYVKDAAGRYLLINREYEKIFHVRREAFVGLTDHEAFAPEHAHEYRRNDLEVMRRNEAVEFEESAPLDDGLHTYISIKFPLRDEHGRVEGVCGISTDITQRLAAELQLRRLAQQLVTVREEERQRLSFRIHDEICQELTGITFMLAAAMRRLGPEVAGVAELDRAGTQLANVIDHLRSVARGLHPVLLRDLGLAESLRALAQTLSTPRVSIDVNIPDTLPDFGAELALAVYRIAQEAVLNAVRHAEPKTVRIVVESELDVVRLAVDDDGRGFETRRSAPRGLGLLGMEQRAISVGGTLHVESNAGSGSRVVFVCRRTAGRGSPDA
jgi:PAS domain S-box-containing protein